MSIIDTLITDRTAADTAALEALFAKAKAGSLTEEENAVLAVPAHKGAYNCTDLNRVSAALEYLRVRLEGYGYKVPGYRRIEVPHKTVAASKLPAGYTEAAYIESSGTQYIDTGFVPNQDSRIVLDYHNVGTSFASLCGSQAAANTSSMLFYLNSSTVYPQYGNSKLEGYAITATTSNRLVYDLSANGAKVGNTSVAVSGATFAAGCNATLFVVNIGGTLDSRKAVGKLYSCQLYDNGTLVRDFVPCINPNGACGLYDKVNGKFYANAGSGAFTSGAVVDPPVAPDDETRDPYLWYEDDIPAAAQMAQYIQNVGVIRSVLAMLPTTPIVPADMEGLTTEEANAIEFILIDVQTLINNMVAAWFYSGDLYSGEV